MKAWRLLLLTLCAASAAQAQVKTVQWGLEAWTLGHQDFTIQFYEPSPVSIVAIEGNLSAAPLAGYSTADTVIRQTLATLSAPGKAGAGRYA